MDHSPSKSLLLREVAERLPKQGRFLLIGLLCPFVVLFTSTRDIYCLFDFLLVGHL